MTDITNESIKKIVEDARLAVKAGIGSVECDLLKEQILQRLNLLSAPERQGMSLKFMELRLGGGDICKRVGGDDKFS